MEDRLVTRSTLLMRDNHPVHSPHHFGEVGGCLVGRQTNAACMVISAFWQDGHLYDSDVRYVLCGEDGGKGEKKNEIK